MPDYKRWSGPLSEDADRCFFYPEGGIIEIEPVEPDKSLPLKKVEELPLVFREPYQVQTSNRLFIIAEEGYYRFSVFPSSIYNRIYYKNNIPKFVGAVSQLHIHGWRHGHISVPELIIKSKDSIISVACAAIREVGRELLSAQGIKTRCVSALTLDRWNSYSCGHALLEYLDPIEKRWILGDPSFGVMFKADGKWLDIDTVCRLVRNGGKWDIIPLTSRGSVDLCTDNISKQYAFYAQTFSFFTDPVQMRRWFEGIFQVPQIGEDFSVDTIAQKERFMVLCGTVNLKYNYLIPTDFRAKYYP